MIKKYDGYKGYITVEDERKIVRAEINVQAKMQEALRKRAAYVKKRLIREPL